MLICVLQGAKGKGVIYKELKKFLISEIPIPSQVILTSTINKPKGFRSVVNKLLIQIAAKTGAEPWAIDNLPFTNQPTMIASYDIYGRTTLGLLGFVSTYNSCFTKYHAVMKHCGTNKLDNFLTECMVSALNNFKQCNNIMPKHIILLKEGISQGEIRRTAENEIKAFKTAFSMLNLSKDDEPKITYIFLTKKINTKLFFFNSQKNDFDNCQPGTIVDEAICDPEFNDFYLISQKASQGVAQPTHYYLAYDEANVNMNDVYNLIYKLSYLYYNWSGSIRVPAPCQYAKKLVQLMGEKLSDRNNVVIPNSTYEQVIKSLYFI